MSFQLISYERGERSAVSERWLLGKAEHPSRFAGVLNQTEVAVPYVIRVRATGSVEVPGILILALFALLVATAVVAYKLLW